MSDTVDLYGYPVSAMGVAYGSMLMVARDDPEVMNRPPIDKTRSIQ